MRFPRLVLFALLGACVPPDDTARPDTDTDSAGPDDTDSVDTADTAPEPPATALRWGDSFAAPDLAVGWCGTDDGGAHAFAPGPDLDGDGLGELAIGVPGHDGPTLASGGVYFFPGSAVADGLRTWDAPTFVTPTGEAGGDGFGARVTWVGDRDGDGLDDLLVAGNADVWSVSGADLLAGGEVGTRAVVLTERPTITRWVDVDGDGRDDWLFGSYSASADDDDDGEGAVSLVLDVDFTLDGITPTTTAYGAAYSAAGSTLAALEGDRDGDGIPEFALTMADEVHIIGSAAFLAGGARLRDAALTTAHYLGNHQIFTPGDVDGDGLDELLVFDGGNKLCVLLGTDGAGDERICIRDAGLGPDNGAFLGDDLDRDGVRDLWYTRDGYLVALDVRALAQGIELELARVPLPQAADRLAYADGRVWASADPATGGGEVDLAYVYTASLSSQREMTITGGGSGGIPGTPTWRDVSGDGAVDLLFADARTVIGFDGATLAAGGSVTWCDAPWARSWGELDVTWIDDANGDGADDALVITEADGAWLHEVWPGQVAIGLAEGEPITSWTDDVEASPRPGCDLDGDGRDELRVRTDVGWYFLGGAVDADGELPILGGVQGTATPGCLPDIDGDGGGELYTVVRDVTRIYRSSQLDPARILRETEAEITLGDLTPVPRYGVDGGGIVTWWREGEGDEQLCVLDLSSASGELFSADVPMTCLPETYQRSLTMWLDAGVGDATPDLFMYGSAVEPLHSIRLVDGASLGASTTLVSPTDELPVELGPGGDVLGVGAGAIWARTADADWPGRYRIDVLFAHASP